MADPKIKPKQPPLNIKESTRDYRGRIRNCVIFPHPGELYNSKVRKIEMQALNANENKIPSHVRFIPNVNGPFRVARSFRNRRGIQRLFDKCRIEGSVDVSARASHLAPMRSHPKGARTAKAKKSRSRGTETESAEREGAMLKRSFRVPYPAGISRQTISRTP